MNLFNKFGIIASSGLSGGNLIVGANNIMFPYTNNSDSSWVHNAVTTHKTGRNPLVNPIFIFLNGIMSQNGALQAYYNFDLRAAVEVNNSHTRAFVNGTESDIDALNVDKNWGFAAMRAAITIPPYTRFRVKNRRAASDAGAAGTYQVITSHGGRRIRQDGIIGGANPAIDYTMGGYGEDGAFNLTVNGSGVITGGTRTNAGDNYTASPSWNAYHGAAGRGQPGATIPSAKVGFITNITKANPAVITTRHPHGYSSGWTGTVSGVGGMTQLSGTLTVTVIDDYNFSVGVDSTGYSNYTGAGEFSITGASGSISRTGNTLNALSVTNGGQGQSSANPPLCAIGGSGSWGIADQTTYGPCLILSEKSNGYVPYMIALVDSNGIGYGSVDGNGDIDGNHGLFEQLVHGELGYDVWKVGRSGDSVQSWVSNHPRFFTFLDAMIDLGLDLSPAIITSLLGTNDFSSSDGMTANFVEDAVADLVQEFTNRRASRLWVGTCKPNTNSTNGFQDGSQTGENVPYSAGGEVLNYNNRLRRGNGTLSPEGIVDFAGMFSDLTDAWKWRYDLYAPNTPSTKDGPHFSAGVAIPAGRAQMLLPPINPLPVTSNLLVHLSALNQPSLQVTNNLVTQWNDSSGNANHAYIADTADQPTINTFRRGGIFIPDFYDSADPKALTINNFDYDESAFTVYMVIQVDSLSVGAEQTLCGFYDSSPNNSWRFAIDASNQLFIYYRSVGDVLVADNSNLAIASTSIPQVVAFRWNNGQPTYQLNMARDINATVPRTAHKLSTGKYSLGSFLSSGNPSTSQRFQGVIAEHLFYNAAHSNAEMDAVISELMARYRIA